MTVRRPLCEWGGGFPLFGSAKLLGQFGHEGVGLVLLGEPAGKVPQPANVALASGGEWPSPDRRRGGTLRSKASDSLMRFSLPVTKKLAGWSPSEC
jgi:hypothetical protein